MLTLSLRGPVGVPVELAGVTPDKLAGLSAAAVARLPVLCGNRRQPLGEFFDATGDPADGGLVIVGDCARVKLVGAGMAAGTLTVEGSVGMHAGAGMTGGTLTVNGHAGDWLAAELRGGLVRVRGNAGHQPAAGYRGSRHGVRGGVVIVHGSAGDEAGVRMRRGLLVVGGSVGAFGGASLVAGTVAAAGGFGPHPGADLKRGTLVSGRPVTPSPGFRFSCVSRPAYLGLFAAYLRELGAPVPAGLGTGPATCYRGDVLHGGLGELFVVG